MRWQKIIDSWIANDSGLTTKNLTNASPSTAWAKSIWVDASGKVVTKDDGVDTTIYDVDWTLAGNRTVTMAGNDLSLTGWDVKIGTAWSDESNLQLVWLDENTTKKNCSTNSPLSYSHSDWDVEPFELEYSYNERLDIWSTFPSRSVIWNINSWATNTDVFSTTWTNSSDCDVKVRLHTSQGFNFATTTTWNISKDWVQMRVRWTITADWVPISYPDQVEWFWLRNWDYQIFFRDFYSSEFTVWAGQTVTLEYTWWIYDMFCTTPWFTGDLFKIIVKTVLFVR